MKKVILAVIFTGFVTSESVQGEQWKHECVGYYQIDLPPGLEMALYAVKNVINPPKEPQSRHNVLVQLTRKAVITFGDAVYENGDDRTQAQFTEFEYEKYKVGISSEDKNEIKFSDYRKKSRRTMNLMQPQQDC